MWRIAAYVLLLVMATSIVLAPRNKVPEVRCEYLNGDKVSDPCASYCRESFLPIKPFSLYCSYASLMLIIFGAWVLTSKPLRRNQRNVWSFGIRSGLKLLSYCSTVAISVVSIFILWKIFVYTKNGRQQFSFPEKYGCIMHVQMRDSEPVARTDDQIRKDLAKWIKQDGVTQSVVGSGGDLNSKQQSTVTVGGHLSSHSTCEQKVSCALTSLRRNFIYEQVRKRALHSGRVPCQHGSPICYLDDNGQLAWNFKIIVASWLLTLCVLLAGMVSDLRAPAHKLYSKVGRKNKAELKTAAHLKLIDDTGVWASTDLCKSPTLPRPKV